MLDIGCGVGHLHQTLLERGARSAVGIDLAPRMLAEAKDWAKQRGLAERVRYLEGDFMTADDGIEDADICLLDKVVCCYPDAGGLVEKSLTKTRRVCGLIYPRDRWFIRLGVEALACLLWVIRSSFRSFVHDPDDIESRITSNGFEKCFQDQTTMWLIQVYARS